ncbi:MAG: hypothetical protein PG977_000794 [Bartonella clarridgeiae]|nr:MAG: hypothetical protein PG977_000794 [Bartonella clarridgeiae]
MLLKYQIFNSTHFIRAADLLGMERCQAEMFRDLECGHFIVLRLFLS